MPPLSSCHIAGVFCLSEASRNSDPTYYAQYLSSIEFSDDSKYIDISIRKFTPSTDGLYVQNTFVFMVAKAALAAGEDGMLDSIYCTPFDSPVDAPSPLPPDPTHTAFVTGEVTVLDTSEPATRSFTLSVSEYVRDERRTFDIR